MAPSDLAFAAAEVINRETNYALAGSTTRPLPLLASYNGRTWGWGPEYQMKLLEKGFKILPWFNWPENLNLSSPTSVTNFDAYFKTYLEYCKDLEIPIHFRGTQWERILITDSTYCPDAANCSSIVTPEDGATRLTPFGNITYWDAPASVYFDTDAMRRVRSFYPEPPQIFFHSNNETQKLQWHNAELDARYVAAYGTSQTDNAKREIFGDLWIDRFNRMIDKNRSVLPSTYWKNNSKFVSYNALGYRHFGRWSGWMDYSLITEDQLTPDWDMWEGSTASYYDNNWEPKSTDYTVRSNQIEAMNYLFQIEEMKTVNSDFLVEMALWDGNEKWWPALGYAPEYEKLSKTCQYLGKGQTYTPDRFEGWAQFGLWVLRPHVIREFRFYADRLVDWEPYFERLISIVEKIHNSEELTEFWRDGELVPNRDYSHPYQTNVPTKYANVDRWFLLNTSLDPVRPWKLDTALPVFSVAFKLGQVGERRWLLYAHSPLQYRPAVRITIPDYGDVVVNVPREGAFFTYSEATPVIPPAAVLTAPSASQSAKKYQEQYLPNDRLTRNLPGSRSCIQENLAHKIKTT